MITYLKTFCKILRDKVQSTPGFIQKKYYKPPVKSDKIEKLFPIERTPLLYGILGPLVEVKNQRTTGMKDEIFEILNYIH